MRHIVIVASDTHCNHLLALTHPRSRLDENTPITLNRIQGLLWDWWTAFIEQVRLHLQLDDRVILILNGDLVDLPVDRPPSQLLTVNKATIIDNALLVLSPLRSLAELCYVVRGTERHTDEACWTEEVIGQQLGAVQNEAEQYSSYHLRLTIGQLNFDVAHHTRIGRLPWTTGNAAGNIVYTVLDEADRLELQRPHVILRSHVHHFLDSGSLYPARLLISPCWQLGSAYGARIAPGSLPHVGGLILTLEDEILDVRPCLFKPRATWTAIPPKNN